MKTITLSHKSLVEDITITMEDDMGVSTTESGFTVHFQDDLGEDEIFDIAYGWLEWQSYANIEAGRENFTGHKYWKGEYTPEERRGFIRKELFTK